MSTVGISAGNVPQIIFITRSTSPGGAKRKTIQDMSCLLIGGAISPESTASGLKNTTAARTATILAITADRLTIGSGLGLIT
tara:strand:+ start:1806 stop:2051 length:246 start_codon:yes stop_codon:yes gene_type:complete